MSAELAPVVEPIDAIVDKYIRLRDAIKKADQDHKEKLAPAREMLDQLNTELLNRLNALGGEAVKTKEGTVYRTSRKSATIADGATFRQYVIQHGEWDLADWRANPTATATYIEEHHAPPPGVNFTVSYEVGVRRA